MEQIGVLPSDYAIITVTAHEWGHHVQHLLSVRPEANNSFELQADCLGGAFTQFAKELGRLDPGDVTEAAELSIRVADSPQQRQDQAGAHGTNDERLEAFMKGYINGLPACNLSKLDRSLPTTSTTVAPQADSPPEASETPTSATTRIEPAPTLVGGSAVSLDPRQLLPVSLALPKGQRFRLHDEGAASVDDVVAGMPDPSSARSALSRWGWQENAYRVFAADDPPRDAVGWMELSVDRFASVDGAAAALPFYAEARLAALNDERADVGLFADQSEAMRGRAFNGEELTIYARRGNLVFRASGITPSGDPTGDVVESLLLALRPLADEPGVVSPELFTSLPNPEGVISGVWLAEEHARSAATVATTFPDAAEAGKLFQEWGWRESAARVFFREANGTPSGTSRLEVSVFRLEDAEAARMALPYFLEARAAALGMSEVVAPTVGNEARAISGTVDGQQEATVYIREDARLLRISAVGEGDPMEDLRMLLARSVR